MTALEALRAISETVGMDSGEEELRYAEEAMQEIMEKAIEKSEEST